MNLMTIKSHEFNPLPNLTIVHKISYRIRKVVTNWFESQSIMKNHWELYCATAQHHVPYRVWLRHGAYLEMKYKKQLH